MLTHAESVRSLVNHSHMQWRLLAELIVLGTDTAGLGVSFRGPRMVVSEIEIGTTVVTMLLRVLVNLPNHT